MSFKKLINIFTIICFSLLTTLTAQEKLAQTGFQFLSVAPEARGAAMGEAVTTVNMGSSSLFFNPAGMARMQSRSDISFSQNNWIADIVHNSFSVAYQPLGGRFGVIGMTYRSIDYGEVQGTMVWGNEQGYIETEVMKPSSFSTGIGYANALTDKFSVGGQAKYTGQQLGKNMVQVGEDSLDVKNNVASAIAFDFGTIYRTGFESLAFGMSVRNFSEEIEYEKEGFLLPLTFNIGISMDVFDLVEGLENQGMLVSIDAMHPRSYKELLKVGAQYDLMETFYVRMGYKGNRDESDMTYGFGIKKFGIGLDYSYTPFGVFDEVQRFSLRISL